MSRCPLVIDKARKELSSIEIDLRTSVNNKRLKREDNILPELKKDPGLFYLYARNFSSSKSDIGPLEDKNEHLTNDNKAMAEILSDQYASMFSTPSSLLSKEQVVDIFTVSSGGMENTSTPNS